MGKRCLGILILASAIICCAVEVRADVALSYLGMCHPSWPCESSLKAFNGLPVIRTGWLEQTFGSECSCADKLLQSPKEKVIRVHLVNGACLRNKRCGRYEVFAGETIATANKKVHQRDRKLLSKYRAVLNRFRARLRQARGSLTCYVSPVLESDLDARARKILRNTTHRRLPGCSYVDSPLRGPCLKGEICELHGPSPKLHNPCIADLDGVPLETVSLPQFLRRTRSCEMQFLWTGAFNCSAYRNGRFIDPRDRECSMPKGLFSQYGRYLRRGDKGEKTYDGIKGN
jgi:hypothetical protein